MDQPYRLSFPGRPVRIPRDDLADHHQLFMPLDYPAVVSEVLSVSAGERHAPAGASRSDNHGTAGNAGDFGHDGLIEVPQVADIFSGFSCPEVRCTDASDRRLRQ